MIIEQYDLWLADFNLRKGFNRGNERPICILQTDLLQNHPSCLIAPVTPNIKKEVKFLRIHVEANPISGLEKNSAIMIDQIRPIDRKRLIRKIGSVLNHKSEIQESLKIIFDIDY